MTTSGTYTFGTDTQAIDLIFEAYQRCGLEPSRLSSWQLDTARTSLGAVFSDWSNRGPNLWTVTQVTQALTVGLQSFSLNTNVIEVLEVATRTTSGGINSDLIISPISRSEYLALNNKAQQSDRPTQYYFDRLTTPTVYLWPTCNALGVTLLLNVWRMNEDIGDFSNTVAAPQRWWEAMASALAWRLAVKFAPERAADLKADYLDAYAAAAAEDTEIVPLRVTPDMSGARWGG